MNLREARSELFGVALDAFVDTRTRLAGELASAGLKDASRDLKKVRRPSASAWATNQMVRRARHAVDAFLAASDRLSKRQAALLDGGGDREAYQSAASAFREATTTLTQAIGQRLTADGHEPERTLVDSVVANLRAAALVPAHRTILLDGQLQADLDASDAGLAGLFGATLADGAATGPALAPRAERRDGASPTSSTPPHHGDPASERASRTAREAREKATRDEAARARAAAKHAQELAVAKAEETAAAEDAVRTTATVAETSAARDAAREHLKQAEAALHEARKSTTAAQRRHDQAERDAAQAAVRVQQAAERRQALESPRAHR